MLGGVVFALTSPPTDLYPAVVVGLALLAAAVSDAPSGWRAFGRGAAWGTAAGIVGLRFVPAVIQRFTSLGTAASYLSLVLLAAGQSLVWAIGATAAHALVRRLRAPLEVAFAAGVFAAVSLPSVFIWTPAGLVSPWPVFVQLADVIGERGVSAVFAFAAALLARAGLCAAGLEPGRSLELARAPRLVRAAVVPGLAAAGIFVALAIHGALAMRSVSRAHAGLPRARIALVSQAVGPHERWESKNHPAILRKLHDLTRQAEAEGAELTVWPEAAYPYALEHGATRAPRGDRAIVGQGLRGPILAGLITRSKPTVVEPGGPGKLPIVEVSSYNSATIAGGDGSLQPTYDKLELLWFGETVPLGRELPWLRRMFQRSGGLVPGDAPRALSVDRGDRPALTLGVLNCYEDTLASVGRRIDLALGPNLLVNVTNDAWFFGTAEPELHARLSVMRAIELRRDLVRAVNMGVMSWIDASGRVIARWDRAEPGVLLVEPALRDGPSTFYARAGDVPVWIWLAVACAGAAWRARQSRAAAGGSDPNEEPVEAEAPVSSTPEPPACP